MPRKARGQSDPPAHQQHRFGIGELLQNAGHSGGGILSHCPREALKNPAIVEMAKKYGVSAAQLCIRYVLQLGAVALPKTANPTHMANNADMNFTISEEDMEALKNMEHIADYGEFNAFPVFSEKPLA